MLLVVSLLALVLNLEPAKALFGVDGFMAFGICLFVFGGAAFLDAMAVTKARWPEEAFVYGAPLLWIGLTFLIYPVILNWFAFTPAELRATDLASNMKGTANIGLAAFSARLATTAIMWIAALFFPGAAGQARESGNGGGGGSGFDDPFPSGPAPTNDADFAFDPAAFRTGGAHRHQSRFQHLIAKYDVDVSSRRDAARFAQGLRGATEDMVLQALDNDIHNPALAPEVRSFLTDVRGFLTSEVDVPILLEPPNPKRGR